MSIRIHNIRLGLDAGMEEIQAAALAKINRKSSDLVNFRLVRRSIDARRNQIAFVYSAELTLTDEQKILSDGRDIVRMMKVPEKPLIPGKEPLEHRPVVVGLGPCGLFCALTLARMGYRPIVLERGSDVDKRLQKVRAFWSGAPLDTECNVQFGEGGAGTFSDGKLTTRIHDPLMEGILQDFVRFGAPEEILYDAKPHIGTDRLSKIVKGLRNEIIRLGGEVFFETRLDALTQRGGRILGLHTNRGELPCDVLVLALGHSARDTYDMLYKTGILMEPKVFSVGLRIEHKQKDIDRALYGKFAGDPRLPAASYQLSYREGERGCYTFCMCPGGVVVAAASEAGTVVTNGMSEYARNRENANAAVCINVGPADFEEQAPMAGVRFQQMLERQAFDLGGGRYAAPVQKVGDFMQQRTTGQLGTVYPSYTGSFSLCDLSVLFSKSNADFLRRSIQKFDQKLYGFAKEDAVLTGIETRTSAPLRILRKEEGESLNLAGLYPAGEGAGYAGGIMSAAVDGVRTAQKIISRFAQPAT